MQAEATLELRVRCMERAADGVLSLTLEHPQGGELPPWSAGAHVDLVFEGIGTAQYSLCGPRGDRCWRVAVLHQPQGRGVSRHIHGALRPGDRIRVGLPRNHFSLEPAPEYLFIAGGIGITPIRAMIEAADSAGTPWRLAYGGRRRAAMAFADELAARSDRVRLFPQDEAGVLPVSALLAEAAHGTAVYCCGPEGLIAAVQAESERLGRAVPHFERFSAAPAGRRGENRAFSVVLARSGVTLEVGAAESIVDVLDARGVFVPTSCRAGVCGSCETRVCAGRIEHRDSILSDAEKERGDTMMVCVSRACGDRLTLDL
ncbi:PDR/VanB family oxidoreductase [Ramlibacter sp. AN1133]|uniref:PDR/VanB family oxidoreductase n=1 Tax=Ramlibacter sp. AN1133 TaxID=3133429 RepID=UPI0030C463F4